MKLFTQERCAELKDAVIRALSLGALSDAHAGEIMWRLDDLQDADEILAAKDAVIAGLCERLARRERHIEIMQEKKP